MKYLVTGVNGQLGYDVVKTLLASGVEKSDICPTTSETMDITNKDVVRRVIEKFKPSVIIHCAAWTNVDGAEDEKEMCLKVNYEGTKHLVDAAKKENASIIVVSTDYVFDGKKDGIYEIDDSKNPQNVYGESKNLAESYALSYDKSFVVRTSWVFGINGKNFVKTMLRLAETKTELNVVCDQVGSPTYTVDLAKFLVNLAATNKYGIYHATNEGYCSWAEFAKYIFTSNGKDVLVHEISTREYPQKAVRPLNSRLSKKCLTDNGFDKLPTWQDAIDRYNKELVLERKK